MLALVACRDDAPTALTAPARLTPTAPALALIGAVSTPILSLAPPGEPMLTGDAGGLNASGQVTGGVGTEGSNSSMPYRWTPGGEVVTLTGCCASGFGADINASGVIVGSIHSGGSRSYYRPFVATGNAITLLPLLPGIPNDIATNVRAFAINDGGDIVGTSPYDDHTIHAVRWNANGAITDLGTLGGSNSHAVDINNAGQIIGMSETAGNAETHAFLWSPESGMQDLNVLTGAPISDVVEINDAGQIIGSYQVSAFSSFAFLFTPGSGLHTLPQPSDWSEPKGLNGRGDVIGLSKTAGDRAFIHSVLWIAGGGVEDINAITGVPNPDLRRLNDNMQTLNSAAWPDQVLPSSGFPYLVQLKFDHAPVARFTFHCVDHGHSHQCQFDATTSTADGEIVSYTWDWGNGRHETKKKPVVRNTWKQGGSYLVTLTVTDAHGRTNSTAQTISVP